MSRVVIKGKHGEPDFVYPKPPYTKAEEEAFYRATAPVNCRGLTGRPHVSAAGAAVDFDVTAVECDCPGVSKHAATAAKTPRAKRL